MSRTVFFNAEAQRTQRFAEGVFGFVLFGFGICLGFRV
jgi:hypothetical protein